MYKLSNEDIMDIKMLQEVGKFIKEDTKRFVTAEVKNGCISKEDIDLYNSHVKIEDSILDRLLSSHKKAVGVLNYFGVSVNDNELNFNDNFDDDNIRIVMYINSMYLEANNLSLERLNEELGMVVASRKDLIDVYQKSLLFFDTFEKEITEAFYVKLNRMIASPIYKKYRDLLINAKYNSFYKEKSTNLDIVNLNNKERYITSRVYLESLPIDIEYLKFYYDRFLLKQIGSEISRILSIEDTYYLDKSHYVTGLIRQIKLRTLLELLSPQMLDYVNDSFHEMIDSSEFLPLESTHITSVELIKDAFLFYKKDKREVSILSLTQN